MIQLTHETRILLCVAPCDFRLGIDGFVGVCKNRLELDPRDGSVVVFINRARTMVRALTYDVNGYWLMSKRLSRGKFTGWPDGQSALSPASARELRVILSGTSVSTEHRPAQPPARRAFAPSAQFATLKGTPSEYAATA